MSEYRMEHDTMGEVKVPAEHFGGHRLREAFRILKSVPKKCRMKS